MNHEAHDQLDEAMRGEGEYRTLSDSLARAHAFAPSSQKTIIYRAEYAAGEPQHFGLGPCHPWATLETQLAYQELGGKL